MPFYFSFYENSASQASGKSVCIPAFWLVFQKLQHSWKTKQNGKRVETGMDAVLSSATRRNICSKGRWVLLFGLWCPSQGYYPSQFRTVACVIWTAVKPWSHLPRCQARLGASVPGIS